MTADGARQTIGTHKAIVPWVDVKADDEVVDVVNLRGVSLGFPLLRVTGVDPYGVDMKVLALVGVGSG